MAASAMTREAVFALRRKIARIEGHLPATLEAPAHAAHAGGDRWIMRTEGRIALPAFMTTGSATLDDALGGGLPWSGLTEIHGAQTRDAGAVAGFALAAITQARIGASTRQPLLWVTTNEILSEAGAPYAPGIAAAYGIAPEALLLASTPKLEDALWIAEEAAILPELAAIFLEMRGSARQLDLTATRRLHRRARRSGRLLFLLRQAGRPEPTAAPVRLLVASAPAGERRLLAGTLDGSIGPPAVSVSVTRSRTGMSATATLEWNEDEHVFRERPADASRTQDTGAMVPVSAERADLSSSLRTGLAQLGRGQAAA